MAVIYAVSLIEQCGVSPPSGSVPNTSLPLTYFDIFWLPTSPVQRLFFYEVNHSTIHFSNTILPNIKHSLSLTLQQFFLLAGNVKWSQDSNKPEIVYSEGDSVSLTVAESDYDFHRLSSNQPREANEFRPLVPVLSNNEGFPLLALQVTLFPNKGLCIGVTYHHTVADGRALLQFVKLWASVCRVGDTSFTTESLPCFDRSLIKDPDEIGKIFLEKLKTKEAISVARNPGAPSDGKVLGTFLLRPSDIKRIKQWVVNVIEKQDRQNKKLHLSTFVLTCAYVWICLVKSQRGEDTVKEEDDSTECFGFPVDCRERLDPPVPSAYFGNCIRLCVAKSKGNDLVGKDGILTAVELIGNAMPTITDGNAILEDMERLGFFDPPGEKKGNGKFRLLGVAGSPRLGVYETDFGWGSPRKAEVCSIANTGGAISLCECPHETGAVEVGVVGSKLEMETFTYLFANTLGRW